MLFDSGRDSIEPTTHENSCLCSNRLQHPSTINDVIIPDMINPNYWNWKGKAGIFWAGLRFICFVWSYFRLPEPKGRIHAGLDTLFGLKVSARRFSSTRLNIFEDIAVSSVEDHAPVSAEKSE